MSPIPPAARAAGTGAAFRHGELAGIDAAARQIVLADGAKIGYDYLILATGVAAAYHGIPGAAEYSLALYTRQDAIVLRDRLMVGLERISRTGLANDVTITVIGGGATGVELAGSLADLRNIALAASYPEIDRDRIHVSLVERAPALLAPFHPALREYTRRQLVKRGVDVRLGTAIREITPDRVLLADGSVLASDATVWAAGVAAPELVSGWGLPQADGGRIRIGADLRVAGHERIFAVGDVALIEDQPLPQLAQPALQMGKHAADQIRSLEQGTADGPVPLPRQGHHGHHRVPLGGGRTAPPGAHPRHVRLARLARAAPDHPARRPQPDLRAGQHVLAVPHLAAWRRPHRRRRPVHRIGRAEGYCRAPLTGDNWGMSGGGELPSLAEPASLTAEERRLREAREGVPWRAWGPYLSERQWGTVREDYSDNGDAWSYFSHDQARSRAYRWGEDGIAGISDDKQRLCLALALWNERDPILKERLFGLTNAEGNHGEDVKEYYFYVDNLPTHSYQRYLYKYPQAEFPYADLVAVNRARSRHELEYELADTGVFDDGRYFDVEVEHAKAGPEDILCRITVHNRSADVARLHVLPTLWFRNTWSWGIGEPKPRLARAEVRVPRRPGRASPARRSLPLRRAGSGAAVL